MAGSYAPAIIDSLELEVFQQNKVTYLFSDKWPLGAMASHSTVLHVHSGQAEEGDEAERAKEFHRLLAYLHTQPNTGFLI